MRVVCLCCLLAALGTACQSRPAPVAAGREVTATYRGRTLTSDLPRRVRVPSVAAAAETALLRRGYTIVRSPATEDYARVEGQAPDGGWAECIVIRARQTPSHTRVEIIAQPIGDQTLSRAILQDLVAAVGL